LAVSAGLGAAGFAAGFGSLGRLSQRVPQPAAAGFAAAGFCAFGFAAALAAESARRRRSLDLMDGENDAARVENLRDPAGRPVLPSGR